MRKQFLVLGVMLGTTGSGLHAQVTTARAPAKPAASAAPVDRSADEKSIKALMEAFVKAFNAGNAEATAATYSETAVVVDEQGDRVEGRAAVRELYAASFAANPGSKIAIEANALHFLGSETGLEEGHTTITPATGAPEITRYTAVYIKEKGQWKQAAVRDHVAHDLTPHEHLKELEWLLGDWVNESQDAIVSTTCSWAKGGNFLEREFTMRTSGQPVLSGNQRIGWDPLKRQFKTWIFDSKGGHLEGYFTRVGNQWIVKVDGVSQDGKPESLTNIITRLDKDRMSWQSAERTLGGAAIPEIDEFVMVRKPPEVGK